MLIQRCHGQWPLFRNTWPLATNEQWEWNIPQSCVIDLLRVYFVPRLVKKMLFSLFYFYAHTFLKSHLHSFNYTFNTKAALSFRQWYQQHSNPIQNSIWNLLFVTFWYLEQIKQAYESIFSNSIDSRNDSHCLAECSTIQGLNLCHLPSHGAPKLSLWRFFTCLRDVSGECIFTKVILAQVMNSTVIFLYLTSHFRS